MSESYESLSHLSREELYSLVNALKHYSRRSGRQKIKEFTTSDSPTDGTECETSYETIGGKAYVNRTQNNARLVSRSGNTLNESNAKQKRSNDDIKGLNDNSDKCETIGGRDDQKKSAINKQFAERLSLLRTFTKRQLKTANESKDNDSETDEEYKAITINVEMSDNSDTDRPKRGDKIEDKYDSDYNERNKPDVNPSAPRERRFMKIYFCDIGNCSQHFARTSDLTAHKGAGDHVFGQPFVCGLNGCPFESLSKEDLMDHMETCDHKMSSEQCVRARENRYACDWIGCDKRFVTEYTLNKHKQHKHLDSTFRWDGRDHIKLAKHATNHSINYVMKVHVNIKHKKCYKCVECGKGWGSKAILKNHMKSHNSDLKITCEWYGCERLFNCKGAMKMHMNTHTGETVYRCQWPGCDKTYFTKCSLRTHGNRQHKGIMDYRCYWPECDYTSTAKLQFHNHINKQHKDMSRK
ncbi:unnamed protein product [Oppiella nova]|uniref:C2H2-type domain-containing protein n=1 Tax=Oppiella nova TaxID=334625 RepID=A0A7R9LVG7_9ACAR|nr:unnamed protein product [Oppiella nova]CAG2167390.1 unnamed protein product [Oppiella nova]